MATLNGGSEHDERLNAPTPHLGKRKRTESPESKIDLAPETETIMLQNDLKDALQLIQRHDTLGIIARHRLTPRSAEEHSIKRQRTQLSESSKDSIEGRILSQTYRTFDELLGDIAHVKRDLADGDKMNGHLVSDNIIDKHFQDIVEALTRHKQHKDVHLSSMITNGNDPDHIEILQSGAQVLSLRSQTESGIKQLFSGLPQTPAGSVSELDGRKLPNGFEIASVASMDQSAKSTKENRTFGDAFAPHRNTKTLETPRPDRRHRDALVLNFVQPYTKTPSVNRIDYKYAPLKTGSWIQYSGEDRVTPKSETKPKTMNGASMSLFKTAFSSFAPTIDHSTAAVTENDRSREWWRRYATRKTVLDHAAANDLYHIDGQSQGNDVLDFKLADDFEELIANYIPDADTDDQDESAKLLSEVSDLIETLNSYQSIRESELARGPSSANKPTKPEIEVYEVLKVQLQLLINELPPYAVAKLNGDQLSELNISTNLIVDSSDFTGTSQPDENNIRRVKTIASATIPGSGRAGTSISRNHYGAPVTSYNPQVQPYGRNASAASYGMRTNMAAYNTPRPGTQTPSTSYSQPGYRTASTHGTPTVQQYQRPVVNGYNQAAVSSNQGIAQKPSQPGYQQRAQDNGTVFARSGSPQKPLTNGQNAQNHQARPSPAQQVSYGESPTMQSVGPQQNMIEVVKPHQQQSLPPQMSPGIP